MRKLVFMATALLVVSCASKSEKKALDIVGDHYGAKTSFSKGFNKQSGEETQKTFTIKVSDSKLIDSLNADLTCANIALMMYENFTPDEKDNYTQVQVELDQNGKKTDLVFKPEVLIQGEDQVAIFTDFSEKIVNEDYDGIVEVVEPKYMVENLALRLKKFVDDIVKDHGKIVSFKRLGYGLMTYDDGSEKLRFNGQFEFEDGYHRAYFLLTSKDLTNDKIQGYSLNDDE